jgi:hypothetical protein
MAFSARLRDEIDLATLTGELLAVVDQTMQPTRASLWLRPSGGVMQQQGDAVARPLTLQLGPSRSRDGDQSSSAASTTGGRGG